LNIFEGDSLDSLEDFSESLADTKDSLYASVEMDIVDCLVDGLEGDLVITAGGFEGSLEDIVDSLVDLEDSVEEDSLVGPEDSLVGPEEETLDRPIEDNLEGRGLTGDGSIMS